MAVSEPVPAWVALLAPRTQEEMRRACEYARQVKLRMLIAYEPGCPPAGRCREERREPEIVSRNAPLVHTYEEIQ
jgi:hypothetical protein